MTTIDYLGFQHQAVRELAWSLTSPPLFQDLPGFSGPKPCQVDPRQLLAWLQALDANPAPLLEHLTRLRSPRLGIYFEGLIDFFWRYYPGHECLAKNLQINGTFIKGTCIKGTSPERQKSTIGELDFVVRRALAPSSGTAETNDAKTSETLHIETAVKFYLGVDVQDNTNSPDDDGSEWSQWIGPNCNDRLDKKLDRLLQHQLPLSQSAHAAAPLREQGVTPADVKPCLQLQGYLFYPTRYSIAAPKYSNPAHLRSEWFYLSDFTKHLGQRQNSHWSALQKTDWLVPASLPRQSALMSSAQMVTHLRSTMGDSTRPRPLLLAEMTKKTDALPERYWQETRRCFVVPDQWPY